MFRRSQIKRNFPLIIFILSLSIMIYLKLNNKAQNYFADKNEIIKEPEITTAKSVEDIIHSNLLLQISKSLLRVLKKIDKIEGFPKVEEKKFEVNYNRGFWKGSSDVVSTHHRFDPYFARALSALFTGEGAETLIDLGAGMGNYSSYLKNEGFFVTCVDGNPNTLEVTMGHCSVADLSLPIDFSPHDWAYSIEVGEHLPPKFEDTFLVNLDRVSRRGVVLSWAIEGQGGDGHFNVRNNDYIIQRMINLGFDFDPDVSRSLRDVASFPWLKNTVMVFRKGQNMT